MASVKATCPRAWDIDISNSVYTTVPVKNKGAASGKLVFADKRTRELFGDVPSIQIPQMGVEHMQLNAKIYSTELLWKLSGLMYGFNCFMFSDAVYTLNVARVLTCVHEEYQQLTETGDNCLFFKHVSDGIDEICACKIKLGPERAGWHCKVFSLAISDYYWESGTRVFFRPLELPR